MKFHYDKKTDSVYIKMSDNTYAESDEVSAGIILDHDKQGKLIGIEVLNASKRLPRAFKDQLSERDLAIVIS